MALFSYRELQLSQSSAYSRNEQCSSSCHPASPRPSSRQKSTLTSIPCCTLRQCDLQLLAHRRDSTRQRKHHPVPRHRHPRILGHGKRVRGPGRRTRRQGNPPLVRVDRMRRTGHADHAERGACHVGRDGESGADGDAGRRNAVDDRTGSEAAGAGVEVWRIPNLHVEVIGGAGAAETAPPVAHGPVEEKNRNGVVVAGDGGRRHLGEGVAGRIEEFGDILGRGVREGDSGDLATGDKDGAVGEDDRVGEGTRVGHGADGLNGGSRRRGAERDDVGVAGGVGILVVR